MAPTITGRVRALAAVLALTLLASVLAACAAHADRSAAPPAPDTTAVVSLPPLSASARAARPSVGVQYHGLWDIYTWRERRQVLDNLVALGATWVRLDVGWTNIQPNPGGYDKAYGVPFVDRVIRMARQRGLKVLVTFWRTPAWANGGRGEVAPPDDPATFARAFAWAVRHWRKQVTHWEVWNEPNLDDYFTGEDPATYVPLLCAAYHAAKAANPRARILFGGTVYNDDDWIRRAYDAGAGGCFDIMAVHPYVAPADTSPLAHGGSEIWQFRHVKAVHALMEAHGDGRKPIWATEFGWSTHDNPPGTAAHDLGVTPELQGTYAVQALQLWAKRFPYVKRVFWYNEHDLATGSIQHDHYGLMDAQLVPKPGYYILQRYLRSR
jgi:hypothetical protein